MHVLVNVGVCVCVCVPGYWVALCACASVTRTSKPPLQPVAIPSPLRTPLFLLPSERAAATLESIQNVFGRMLSEGTSHWECRMAFDIASKRVEGGKGGTEELRGVSGTGSRVGFGLVSVFRLGLSEMTSEVLLVLHTSTKCNTHTYTDRQREIERERKKEREGEAKKGGGGMKVSGNTYSQHPAELVV